MTNEIVTIRPPELTFRFELKKQSSCPLQLVNNMDSDVAFQVLATSTNKYCFQPKTGVLPPQSTCDVTVTMNAQPEAPQDMQCKDKFFVQSFPVPAGTTAKDIPPEMFFKKFAQTKELRVVYVSPVQTTSPEPQSLEDESAAKDFVDNLSQVIDAKDKKDARFYNAVVKVYCTHAEPDYFSPWLKKRPYTSTSSAFMICDRKLLTNAHCVEHHTQVKVQRKGDDTKYVATVLAKGVECDIALLSVESEGFWKGTEPLRFGRLPCLQDAVTVVGYPQGGDSISVTKGVVSRIEVISYVHGAADLLGIQIDAAINYGNSGGPVFNDSGECIGIAFQVVRSAGAENIGYVIPITVVSHFLNDYDQNGKYTGFPCLGVSLQKLENPALRARLKVTVNEGVLIREIEPTTITKEVLRKGDVILSFDAVPVANNGTVPFGSTERIAFEHLISEKFTGDAAKLEIIRKRKKMNVVTTLKPPVYLVPYHIEGGQPSYLIVAGLVFTILSEPLIKHEREESKRTKLMAKARYTLPKFEGEQMVTEARYSLPKFEGEQMVILSQVLDSDINIGYENIRNQQVLKLNGIKIQNIRHLAYLVDSCNGQFLTFMLEHNFLVVMERKAALAATPQILKVYGIACERSPDLLELCNKF